MRRNEVIILSISAIIYFFLAYYTPRTESAFLLIEFISLFTLYFYLLRIQPEFTFKQIFFTALFLRVLFLFSTPNLSDDVYRFIWDGELWLHGVDAYQFTPNDIVASYPEMQELYIQLNSPFYFTIYPPLNQLIFILAALFNNLLSSIVVIRLMILVAEVFSLYGLYKILQLNKISIKPIMLYAFNPLVIIELSGNLHFEAFVVSFIIWSVYYFYQQREVLSGILMGVAIGFKILPILLLASFFKKVKLKKYIKFTAIGLSTSLLCFLPIIFTQLFTGITNSAQLYFQSFEFNASIYYLMRYIGYQIYGYNIIQLIGPYMAGIGLLLICIYNLLVSKKVIIWERMLFSWFIYCLFATTIHPWYIIPMVLFGSLSHFKFPILWSLLISFTYIGYSTSGFSENLWITAFEYILLISFAVFEVYTKYFKKNDQNIHAY